MRNEGDVVLAHDERKARAQWTIGVVEKINPSIDNNKLRSVIVDIQKIEQYLEHLDPSINYI